MVTVAIIPARGQSKTLPRKNLRRLDGRPLIVHTIEAARNAALVDRVVVSTDDDAIARVALAAGAEVPFRRPAELATDEAPTIAAVLHAVDRVESAGGEVGDTVTLQPTSPFRTARMIDETIERMRETGADSAVSVAPVGLPISVLGFIDADTFVTLARPADGRRQRAPTAFRLTGGIYVTSRSVLRSGALLGARPAALVVDGAAAMDIDTRADLDAARRVARERRSR